MAPRHAAGAPRRGTFALPCLRPCRQPPNNHSKLTHAATNLKPTINHLNQPPAFCPPLPSNFTPFVAFFLAQIPEDDILLALSDVAVLRRVVGGE